MIIYIIIIIVQVWSVLVVSDGNLIIIVNCVVCQMRKILESDENKLEELMKIDNIPANARTDMKSLDVLLVFIYKKNWKDKNQSA